MGDSMETSTNNQNGDLRPKLAAATFVVILLGIGIPVWWQTTTVHRAHLPYNAIEELSTDVLKQSIRVYVKTNSHDFANLFNVQGTQVAVLNITPDEHKIILSDASIEELDELIFKSDQHDPSSNGFVFFELPPGKFSNGSELVFGRHRHIYVSSPASSSLVSSVLHNMLHHPGNLEDKDNKFTLAISYNILITLATSDADFEWDPSLLVDYYLASFVTKLASVANLTVSTQVIYLGNGLIDAHLNKKTGTYDLNEDKVASLINMLEPKLGSQLSVEPTFHWVIYVPHVKQRPMQIRMGSEPVATNAALSPRWNGGGLQIVNDAIFDAQACSELLISQLRNALGIEDIVQDVVGSSILAYDFSGVHQWELEHLTRRRTNQFLSNAANTLKSLCQLLSQIENIVISDAVGDDIVTSLDQILESRRALEIGDTKEAYKAAQVAITCSERAFFHPSLLALLYFPDDQKFESQRSYVKPDLETSEKGFWILPVVRLLESDCRVVFRFELEFSPRQRLGEALHHLKHCRKFDLLPELTLHHLVAGSTCLQYLVRSKVPLELDSFN